MWSFAAATLISWTGFESVQASSPIPVKLCRTINQSKLLSGMSVVALVAGRKSLPKCKAGMRMSLESSNQEQTKVNKREFWQEAFSLNTMCLCWAANSCCWSKAHLANVRPGKFGPLGKYREISVNVDGSDFDVILIDISSAPFVFRESTLIAMADVMNKKTGRPTLLMGDFNTPTNSVHFKGLRQKWSNAFEHVGEGYAPTWPVPAPMLVLDQIWYNERIEPTRCELEWSTASDHRPVLVEMNLPQLVSSWRICMSESPSPYEDS